jgi:pyruvate,water dikinase
VLHPVSAALLGHAGGKAYHVARLARLGLPVPRSRVLTYRAAARVAAGDRSARARLRDEVTRGFDLATGVAVRSSADVEDSAELSYAGQFMSVLDVRDPQGVVDAVGAVVASASSPGVEVYRRRQQSAGPVRMGVLLQQMVTPSASGVTFTIDPATGLHDVVIEAVSGRGDALVQDGVTPQRWVVRGGTIVVAPVEQPLLPAEVLLGMARQAARAAAAARRPLDLEWVHDGDALTWVQARPVTGLTSVPLYSRRIARDVLPGEVLPLVLTVNSEVVNPAWVAVLRSLVGDVTVDAGRMARTFGYRAYFDMTAFADVFTTLGLPADSLERLLGLPGLEPGSGMRPGLRILRHLPRAGVQVLRWARTDADEVVRQLARAERDSDPCVDALDADGLLAAFEHAIGRARMVARHSIEVPLVLAAHESLLRRSPGAGPTTHVCLAEDRRREALDPAVGLRRLATALRSASDDDRAAVGSRGVAALTRPGLAAASAELDALLATFGHLAERSNNLSLTTWAEDPNVPLHLAWVQASDRPDTSTGAAVHADALIAASAVGVRPAVAWLCDRTGELRLLREQVSLSYGRTYMRLRPLALALGQRLTDEGVLDAPQDVFLLTLDEIRAAVRAEGAAAPALADAVRQRRVEVRDADDLDLPDVVIGDDFVPRARVRGAMPDAAVTGTAASAGRHVGTLRVLDGLASGQRLRPGDVLAVETSDVTWTTLFDRAGAVVAESGGLLSHAAVVARERGIPCVVSASGATRLPDGATVEVDGYLGTVRVLGPVVR